MSKRRKISKGNGSKPSLKSNGEESEDEEEESIITPFQLEIFQEIRSKIANSYGIKKNENIRKNYNRLITDKRRIRFILQTFPFIDQSRLVGFYHHPVRSCLNKEFSSVLHRIYKKHHGKKYNFSKAGIVQECLSKFYGKRSLREKREDEDENIKMMGDFEQDEDFRFFELCEVLIPNEILDLILSNLPRNLEILTKIGGTCQHLYVKLLTSWKHVTIRSKNIYKISTLALKNVEGIAIQGITLPEQKYIWKHVGTRSLKTLTVRGNKKQIRTIFNLLHTLSKSKKRKTDRWSYPVHGVENLNLDLEISLMESKPAPIINCSYTTLFPSLRTIAGLDKRNVLEFLSGSTGIQKISTLTKPCKYGDWKTRENRENVDWLSHHITDKKSLRALSLSKPKLAPGEAFYQKLHSLLSELPNLRSFHFVFDPPKVSAEEEATASPETFPLGRLFSDECLKNQNPIEKLKLIIQDTENNKLPNSLECIDLRKKEDISIQVNLRHLQKPLMVEELVIKSTVSVPDHDDDRPLRYLDFNLEDLLVQKFLSFNSQHHLKSFQGDMIIRSRRNRDIGYLEKEDVENYQGSGPFLYGRRMKVYAQELNYIFTLLFEFTKTSMFNFRKFDISIRSSYWFFEMERVVLEFKKMDNSIKRLRIRYLTKRNDDLKKEDFSEEHLGDEKARIKFIYRRKRPCFLLFLEYLRMEVGQLLDQVDVFEIGLATERVLSCFRHVKKVVNMSPRWSFEKREAKKAKKKNKHSKKMLGVAKKIVLENESLKSFEIEEEEELIRFTRKFFT